MLPVFRYPNQVIFQIVNSVLCSSDAHVAFIAGLSTIWQLFLCVRSRRTAFIPPASWRVFSRRSL
jgi:hypothetical protein